MNLTLKYNVRMFNWNFFSTAVDFILISCQVFEKLNLAHFAFCYPCDPLAMLAYIQTFQLSLFKVDLMIGTSVLYVWILV